MATTRSKGLLHFGHDSNLVTKGWLVARGIIEPSLNRPFFILVTNNTIGQRRFEKYKVLRHVNDNISTIVSSEATQRSSQDEQWLPSIEKKARTKEKSSARTSQNEKELDWCKSIVIPEEHSK